MRFVKEVLIVHRGNLNLSPEKKTGTKGSSPRSPSLSSIEESEPNCVLVMVSDVVCPYVHQDNLKKYIFPLEKTAVKVLIVHRGI